MTIQSLWFFRAGGILTEVSSLWHGERGAPLVTPVTYTLLDTTVGPWLIDCGFATRALHDPTTCYGQSGARVRFSAGDTLTARLAEAGVDPADIAGVILTHLHFDHCGGLHDLPAATPVYVHDHELAAARATPGRLGYVAEDLAAPVAWRPLSPDCPPLEGVEVIETPGHSLGHCSLALTLGSMRVLITGDAAPTVRNLHERILPGLHVDPDAAAASLDRLIREARAQPIVLPSHDAAFWTDDPAPIRQFVAAY